MGGGEIILQENLLAEPDLLSAQFYIITIVFVNSGPEIDPPVKQILLWKKFRLPLIRKEHVVSYWQKNGHLLLVNYFQESCPGTVWLSN